MKIYWDLDGVLRDLAGFVALKKNAPYPTEWDSKYAGQSLFDCVEADMSILTSAPPTGYLGVALSFFPAIEIWTCQPKKWQSATAQWIADKTYGKGIVSFLTQEEKEERLNTYGDIILVEDSPKFTSYDKILLIDRPYNQGIRAARVFGTRHLKNILELIKEEWNGSPIGIS